MEELLADELALLACELDELDDLLRDPLLLRRARARPARRRPRTSVCGASTPGIDDLASASSRYWTIIIAWFRSSTACR